MPSGRSLWAIPVLAMLSVPVTSLTAVFDDVEPVVAPASVSLSSAPTVQFYLSPPKVQGTFQSGVTLETFDTMPLGAVTNSAVLAIGTITGGSICPATAGDHGGAVTSSASPVSTGGVGTPYAAPRTDCVTPYDTDSVTISLTAPSNYFGFYWTGGDGSNYVDLLSGGQVVASFTSADLMTLIPQNQTVSAINTGAIYANNDYRNNPRNLSLSVGNPFAYVHAVITNGAFEQIRMTSGRFEFDNLATASLSATFDPTGLVGVPLTYTLSYDLQGGSGAGTNSSSPSVGSAVALPAAPTRAGYVFTGWHTAASGGSPLGATFTQTSPLNTTLYAQWAPIVTFDANGGTGTTATQSATGSTALRVNTYARPGYTFAGWSTTSNGAVTYADGAPFTFASPSTLYAQWTQAPNPATPQLPLVTLPVATTTPSTTLAPTVTTPSTTPSTPTTPTTPTTTAPSPTPDTTGALPTMQPGESLVTDNGTSVAVDVFLDGSSTLVMRGQDFQLNLAGDCEGGCSVVNDQTGRETIELREDGNALIDGFGFMPGSLVHIWMFSDPTYLGSLTVADDGTFQGSVYLEGIAPGAHTLQVNGTSLDGNDRSANLGVVVAANAGPSTSLPATGGGSTAPVLVLAALALLMLGTLARRRA